MSKHYISQKRFATHNACDSIVFFLRLLAINPISYVVLVIQTCQRFKQVFPFYPIAPKNIQFAHYCSCNRASERFFENIDLSLSVFVVDCPE